MSTSVTTTAVTDADADADAEMQDAVMLLGGLCGRHGMYLIPSPHTYTSSTPLSSIAKSNNSVILGGINYSFSYIIP